MGIFQSKSKWKHDYPPGYNFTEGDMKARLDKRSDISKYYKSISSSSIDTTPRQRPKAMRFDKPPIDAISLESPESDREALYSIQKTPFECILESQSYFHPQPASEAKKSKYGTLFTASKDKNDPTQQSVIIKMQDITDKEDIEQEIKLHQKISNITSSAQGQPIRITPKFYKTWTCNKAVFIAMENWFYNASKPYGTLNDYPFKTLSKEEQEKDLNKIISLIETLQNKGGVVHTDLHGNNILFKTNTYTKEREFTIIDFGLSHPITSCKTLLNVA